MKSEKERGAPFYDSPAKDADILVAWTVTNYRPGVLGLAKPGRRSRHKEVKGGATASWVYASRSDLGSRAVASLTIRGKTKGDIGGNGRNVLSNSGFKDR